MSAELRMGVIGGGISRAHLPAERDVEGMRTVAVCDIDEVGGRRSRSSFGVPTVHTDRRDLVAADEMEAMTVLQPHHPHRVRRRESEDACTLRW
jgi:predicted dehydrogenase